MSSKNIHPVFDKIVQREAKENLLKQRSVVLWFTGLSGSGKTTIAVALENELHNRGLITQVLDGDNIRSGINNNLGFSEEDRTENIRRIAEIGKLFLNCGVITINCFVSPTIAMRDMAREIIGSENFIEVFINTPLEICEERDVKGLYKKARAGEIKDFTGIHEAYEAPVNPELEIKTENKSVEENVQEILDFLIPKIKV